MIFKYLYRRRVTAAFEQFMDRAALDKLVAETAATEWEALKFFLPRRWFYSEEQRTAALQEVARLADYHAKNGPDAPPRDGSLS